MLNIQVGKKYKTLQGSIITIHAILDINNSYNIIGTQYDSILLSFNNKGHSAQGNYTLIDEHIEPVIFTEYKPVFKSITGTVWTGSIGYERIADAYSEGNRINHVDNRNFIGVLEITLDITNHKVIKAELHKKK